MLDSCELGGKALTLSTSLVRVEAGILASKKTVFESIQACRKLLQAENNCGRLSLLESTSCKAFFSIKGISGETFTLP